MASVPRRAGEQSEPLGRQVDRRGRAAGAAAIAAIAIGVVAVVVLHSVGGDEGGGLRGLAGAEGDRHAHRLVARRPGRRRAGARICERREA